MNGRLQDDWVDEHNIQRDLGSFILTRQIWPTRHRGHCAAQQRPLHHWVGQVVEDLDTILDPDVSDPVVSEPAFWRLRSRKG